MEKISVTLTNRHAYIEEASDKAISALRNYWSYYTPGHYFSKAFQLYLREKARAVKEGREDEPIPGWDGKAYLFTNGYIPAGLFRASRKDAEQELNIRFQTTKEHPEVKPCLPGLPPATKEYNFQNECVDAMLKALPRGGGIVTAATGTGKTATCARFFAKLSYPCLFVVHRVQLLYQSQKEITRWTGKEAGIVGDSVFDPRDITIATVQTLKLHQDDPKFERWFKKVKIVVVDELHKQLNKKNFSLLNKLKPMARYGLTATLQLRKKPVRMKAWAFAGPVLYDFPITTAIKKDVVSKGKILQLSFPEEYHWTEKDYHREYDYEVIDNDLKQQAVRRQVLYLLSQGRYVLILAERLRHVEVLDGLFKDIKHRLAYGGIAKTRREQSQGMFEDGRIKLMIASGVFKDGINLKRVDAIIDMTEWPGKDDTLQKFGRGVRKHMDKDGLLYIDYATQEGRFRKTGVSRSNAWAHAGLPVQKVKVHSVKDALDAIKKEVK